MYKTLGFMWLHEVFCPASAFATADRDGARNPQHFIHVSVGIHCKKTLQIDRLWQKQLIQHLQNSTKTL